MKEINTYEEYVLNELEEKKSGSKKFTEVCKEYLEVRTYEKHVLTVNPP